ncbi:MAG: AAA family ATPase, partial [Spirochaetaceae bacterium]|nr:AAA family ATPase [Spirochaetaceae bacterium]
MPEFNELLGFTENEVRGILETYRGHGVFDQDADEAMAVMGEWYNGYRFAKTAGTDLYNTDMVLYYLKASIPNRPPPDNLIDRNVRIDYGKLRHLLTVNRRLNGNFDLLRHLIGEGWLDSELLDAFPLERLAERENFLSLLHYFGLLSIRAVRDDLPRLGIPNQTVRRLMYGYLRDGFRDVEVFAVDRSSCLTRTGAEASDPPLFRIAAGGALHRSPSDRFAAESARRAIPRIAADSAPACSRIPRRRPSHDRPYAAISVVAPGRSDPGRRAPAAPPARPASGAGPGATATSGASPAHAGTPRRSSPSAP